MKMINTQFYDQLAHVELHPHLKQTIDKAGYSGFRILVDQFENAVKFADEEHFDQLEERILRAIELFPEPVHFSPTWQNFWHEIQTKLRWKRHVYASVNDHDRAGEWQIIMDNPFTNQEVVCYPSLSFKEAAYLFGYFKPTLELNEYIRVQKVVTSLIGTGE
jgi:hypothetical protein